MACEKKYSSLSTKQVHHSQRPFLLAMKNERLERITSTFQYRLFAIVDSKEVKLNEPNMLENILKTELIELKIVMHV